MTGPEWEHLPSVTSQEHKEIAAQFTTSRVPDEYRPRVDQTTEMPGTWWKGHFALIKALGLDQDWKRFHNDRILLLLTERLSRLGIDPEKAFGHFGASQYGVIREGGKTTESRILPNFSAA